MFKSFKIHKFKNQIKSICEQKGYTLLGDIRKCSIGENNWTFGIKAKDKSYLVKLIVPYGYSNTSICINSKKYISTVASVFIMRGLFGSIDIPVTKEFHFKLPESAFGIDANNCEKVFLIYPKCTQFYLRETDSNRLTGFRVGLMCDDISIHDGSSFRYLLEYCI